MIGCSLTSLHFSNCTVFLFKNTIKSRLRGSDEAMFRLFGKKSDVCAMRGRPKAWHLSYVERWRRTDRSLVSVACTASPLSDGLCWCNVQNQYGRPSAHIRALSPVKEGSILAWHVSSRTRAAAQLGSANVRYSSRRRCALRPGSAGGNEEAHRCTLVMLARETTRQ